MIPRRRLPNSEKQLCKVQFHVTEAECKALVEMAKEGGFTSANELARSIVLTVLEDERCVEGDVESRQLYA